MYCENCGTPLDEQGVCPTCPKPEADSTTPVEPPVLSPEPEAPVTPAAPETPAKKKPPVVAIAAIAVVAVVAVILAVVLGGGKPKGIDALYKAFETTKTAYNEELALLVSGNEVLSRMEAIGKDSSAHTVEAAGYGTATITNDKTGNVLSITAESPMLPVSLGAFFCDDKLIFAAADMLVVEAPTTMLGDEINAFLTKNGMPEEAQLESLNSIDFGYSALAALADASEDEEFIKEAEALSRSFFEAATIELGTGEITIGGAQKNCDVIDVTMDMKTFSDWYSAKLFPWLRESEYFKDYFKKLESVQTYGTTYEDFLEMLDTAEVEIQNAADEEGSIHYRLKTIKDVIVSFACIVTSEGDTMEMEVSFTGEKYHLDEIFMRIAENGVDQMTFSMKGSHINTNHITSTILVKDNTSAVTLPASFVLDWDAKGGDNNFTVSVGGMGISMTLRLDGEDVLVAVDIPYAITGSWRMSAGGSVTVPAPSVKLADLDMMSLYSIILGGF